jgi:predicted neuraminidase
MIRNLLMLFVASLPLSFAIAAPAPASAIVVAEFIHEPGAYPQCHASTIAETPDGGLVAAWFGGTHERHPDVCIWLRRFEHGRWLPEVRVADGVQHDAKRYPCWNPVLFQPRRGPLLLFYKVGPTPSTWWGMLTTSPDGGKTWSEPRRLPEDILGPIKNKPVELADGSLLCGSSTEDPQRGWRVHLERTTDLGRTWELIRLPEATNPFDSIQPAILTHADGRLQLLCRSKERAITTSWSADRGRTWTPLVPSGLFAPNSGIDAVTLADGRQLLVYNHRDPMAPAPANSKVNALGPPAGSVRHAAEDWDVRWPLNVALSDDGVNWKMVLTLEDQPRKDGYAYPAVIQTRDGRVHITYTWGRVKIKHVVLDPRRL